MSRWDQLLYRYLSGDDSALDQLDAPTAALEQASLDPAESEDWQRGLPTPEELDELERLLLSNPVEVLGEDFLDPSDDSLTVDQYLEGIEALRWAGADPEGFLRARARESLLPPMAPHDEHLHPDFTFPGYGAIEITYARLNSVKFEFGDLRYVTSGIRRRFTRKYTPYPSHTVSPTEFVYDVPAPIPDEGLDVALFADFGNGLYAPRYIAQQLVQRRFPYAFHLGDVYYGGTKRQFRRYYHEPLEPLFAHTVLFSLLENHEMDSGGRNYFEFLDGLRGRPNQLQEGAYFCVRFGSHQIIGLDVNYDRKQRLSTTQLVWLGKRLSEGGDRVNILLTGGGPYKPGKTRLTSLYRKDLEAVVKGHRVDLWLWGHHHYAALFQRDASRTPFVGAGIGHGGYPYSVKSRPVGNRPPIAWMETAPRFPPWTGNRQRMGNNGFCELKLLPDGGIDLVYRDWMTNVRCRALLRRLSAKHPLEITGLTAFDLPGPP